MSGLPGVGATRSRVMGISARYGRFHAASSGVVRGRANAADRVVDAITFVYAVVRSCWSCGRARDRPVGREKTREDVGPGAGDYLA